MLQHREQHSLLWKPGMYPLPRLDGGDSGIQVEVLSGVVKVDPNGTVRCGVHNSVLEDPYLVGVLGCVEEDCGAGAIVHVGLPEA